jgi:hypothetical protein
MTREQKKWRKKVNKGNKRKEIFVKDLYAGIAVKKVVVAIPADNDNNVVELVHNGIVFFTESGEKALYALNRLGEKVTGDSARVLFVNY